jgi:hypothetical protein
VQAGGQQNQRPLACLDFLKNGFDFDVAVNYCQINIIKSKSTSILFGYFQKINFGFIKLASHYVIFMEAKRLMPSNRITLGG